MARTKLEDIISYAETKLSTVSDLDTVKYTDFDSAPIRVKTFGAHIYLADEDFSEDENKHIGPLLSETYAINVDIIINRRSKSRSAMSDSKGISYWLDTTKALFRNGTNNGLFRNSLWGLEELDDSEDVYILKGILTVEILNVYT